ncbi:MAG: protease SohB [Venatoribacter sp.]
MDFLLDYGSFLLKAVTVVVAIIFVVGTIISLKQRSKSGSAEGHLVIKKLNDELDDYKEDLEIELYSEAELKLMDKERKKAEKEKEKAEKKRVKEKVKEAKNAAKTEEKSELLAADDEAEVEDEMAEGDEPEDRKKRVYVLDFNGDVQASETELLRHEITAVLTMASAQDEIVLRLESPGGMVHSYGFAASQLARIRNKQIPLTICVDHVAASGGYMMASIANKIVAAPFAVVGSIGVVATLPNFNKVLKKYDVDYEQFTAGEYKRTVTMFGENTTKAKEKFQADLEDTHVLFKQHINQYRPDLNVEDVATGEIWYGSQALAKGLIDEVGTSDDYIVEACKNADVYSVRYEFKKTLQEKLGLAAQAGVEKAALRIFTLIQRKNVM